MKFPLFNINNTLVAVISIFVYHFAHIQILKTSFFTTDSKQLVKTPEMNASSIWCRGGTIHKRLCRFHNLCIHPDGEFIFFHGSQSIISGISLTKFKEAIVELASVEGHNALTLTLTDYPHDRIDDLPWTVKYIEETSFIQKRFKPNNLMHVIHDDLMPLHSTLIEINMCSQEDQCEVKLVFVDLFPKGPFWDFYKLFSKSEPIVLSELSAKEIYCFKESYAGVNRNTVWYQYGFSIPQSPWPSRTVNANDIHRFTSFVISSLSAKIYPSTCPTTPVTVLVSRKNTRLILNERKIGEMIQNQMNTTVVTLSLDDHSLVDIIAHVRCAKTLIGMHGALLVLAAFLPKHSILIELFPFGVPPEDYTPYKTLANLPGMEITYKEWVNTNEENTITHQDWPKQLGGIGHLPIKEREEILIERSIKPHLCCSDPHWLFRIYQDTIVDIESFKRVLKDALEENEVKSKLNRENDEWRKYLLPGRVYNLSCQMAQGDVVLSWDPPKNLRFLQVIEVNYEVWYKFPNNKQNNLVVTKKRMESIKNISLPVDVWVRTIVNGEKQGPLQWIGCNVN